MDTARRGTGCGTARGAARTPSRWPWLDRIKDVLSPHRPYVWLCYLPLYFIPWFWRAPETVDIVAAVVGIGLFLVLYLTAAEREDWRSLPHVVAITLLSFALAFFHGNFSVITVYAAAVAGNMRPTRLAAWAVVGVSASLALFTLIAGLPAFSWLIGVFFSLIVGVSCIFTAKLQEKNRQLERSQEDIRVLAATAERERIARDLHDLLGHTLTVVAVKSDLAAKLVERDPARAKREMEEMGGIARTALADIRAAVTGMRGTALAVEAAQARRALAAAEVTMVFHGPPEPLPPAVEGVMAMLLREGATNIVRHAKAGRCDVSVAIDGGEAVLTIADDGVGGAPVPGNGLTGMRERVEALGGRLEIDGRQGLRVTARLPLSDAGEDRAAVAVGTGGQPRLREAGA